MLEGTLLSFAYRDPRLITHTHCGDERGIWAGSSLPHVSAVLRTLIHDGAIDPRRWLCDTGCGDMRVGALAASLGIPAIGIEFDSALAARASDITDALRRRNALRAPVIVACGDFTRNETYERAGLRFCDIGTFYNFETNIEDLTAKIASDSPSGTALLYSPLFNDESAVSGLELFRSFRLRRYLWKAPHTRWMHAYRKP